MRFFKTIRALQDTESSLDAIALFNWSAESAEARIEQFMEIGEVISRDIYPWGPKADPSP